MEITGAGPVLLAPCTMFEQKLKLPEGEQEAQLFPPTVEG